MTLETIVSSPSKTVVIGPGRPFVIIGERINPTGRKKLAAEMQAGDFSRVRAGRHRSSCGRRTHSRR